MALGDLKVLKENISSGFDETTVAAEGYKKIEIGSTEPTDTSKLWIDTNTNLSNLMYDNVEEAYTKTQNFTATSATHSTTSTYTIALGSNQVHILTAAANFTIDVSGQVAGATYALILKQDSGGSRAISWSSAFKWSGGTAPSLVTTANAVHILSFISDGTSMYGVGIDNFS